MELTGYDQLTGRDRAILRAVARGDAELACGAEPDLFLGGRCCCDQSAAHRLARLGLIAAAIAGSVGQRVPAQVTAAGWEQMSGSTAPVAVQTPAVLSSVG